MNNNRQVAVSTPYKLIFGMNKSIHSIILVTARTTILGTALRFATALIFVTALIFATALVSTYSLANPLSAEGLTQLNAAANPAISKNSQAYRVQYAANEGKAPVATPETLKKSTSFSHVLKLLERGKMDEAFYSASNIKDMIQRRTALWAVLTKGRNFDIPADEMKRAADEIQYWPSQRTIEVRLVQSFINSGLSDRDIVTYFNRFPPQSTTAKLHYIASQQSIGQTGSARAELQKIWHKQDLSSKHLTFILSRLKSLLDARDMWLRAARSLYLADTGETEKLMLFLNPAQKTMASAGIAVHRKQKASASRLNNVAPMLKKTALYSYLMTKFLLNKKQIVNAAKVMQNAPNEISRLLVPDAFWRYRRWLARDLVDMGQGALAYKIVTDFQGESEGKNLDKEFHAGWIALSILGKPKLAFRHFTAMKKLATIPTSISKANFWMGRANEAMGSSGRNYYKVASTYPTTYYGQLAMTRRGINRITKLPSIKVNAPGNRQLMRHEIAQGIMLLSAHNKAKWTWALFHGLSKQVKSDQEWAQLANFAENMGQRKYMVILASMGINKGVPLFNFAYPLRAMPQESVVPGVDPAFAMAIARQESRFDTHAKSHAGALGLMQIMPKTARSMAKKLKVKYSKSSLTASPKYNTKLGTAYLRLLLDKWDGSLIKTIAGYNAGGGRVERWVKTYGEPQNGFLDPVDWVERIPYAETRKYVQHVLSNYQIYRARLGNRTMNLTELK